MRNRNGENIVARKPKPEPDDPQQSERFVEVAKALDADQSGEGFIRALKSIAKPAPMNRRQSTKKSDDGRE